MIRTLSFSALYVGVDLLLLLVNDMALPPRSQRLGLATWRLQPESWTTIERKKAMKLIKLKPCSSR
ncbi:MAG: hypothetical protein M2R45_00394 [Verrucomicrobia subdivision 3 bacterium]|nr:hypothetical protein [Limisphaerales bacterium]MCS1412847.1 hypothetical protein [Limisphaerales bacterium]